MKTKFISIAALLLLGTNYSYAQKMYARVGVGYGFATSKESMGTNSTISSSSFSDKAVNGTLGSGLQLGAALGYNFSEHFGAELGVQYQMGAKVTTTETNNSGSTTVTSTTTMKSNQLKLMPALVIKTGGEKVEPYARMGLILPVGGSTKTKGNTKTASDETITEAKTTGAFNLGWHSALGINYHLSEKMSIFGEVNLQSLAIGAKKTVLTKYSVSGKDVLSNLKTIDKETTYVTEITDKSNGKSSSSMDNSKPAEELRTFTQFGNAGINIGIKIGF